jgi:hypothetical protein
MEQDFRLAVHGTGIQKVFGRQLRKEFQVSDGLPDSMVMALQALASKHNDNLPAVASDPEGASGTNAPLACNGD